MAINRNYLMICCVAAAILLLLSMRGSVSSSSVGGGIFDCSLVQPQRRLSGVGETVLVTGAAGFIGSHVARHCVEQLGMTVIAVDDLSGGFMANVPAHANLKFVVGDVKDAAFLDALFKAHRFSYVYHLAAYAAEGLSHFVRQYNYENNLVGSVNVLNQAVKHRVKCFVFTSSIAAYGSGRSPMDETMTPLPEDPYGIAKYSMELDLKAAKHMWGLDYVIFRPHNVYGPNQNLYDKYRNVIGIFINQILSNLPMTIFGDGKQTRAFSYIDDVAPIIAQAPLLPPARNEVFNVGADTPYELNKLATEVARAMDVPINLQHLDARKEVLHAVADHSKVRCYFQPPPATDLRSGLAKMTAWVKQQGQFFTPVEFEAVEVLNSMPPSWVRKDLQEHPSINHRGPTKKDDARLARSAVPVDVDAVLALGSKPKCG